MARKRDDEERDDEEEVERPQSIRKRKDDDERPRSIRKRKDEDERPRSVRKRKDDDEREDEEEEDEDQPRSIRKFKKRLSRSHLRSIALYQRCILVCILVYFLAVGAQAIIPEDLRWVLGLTVGLPVIFGAAVFSFLLATKLYDPPMGIVLGILSFIPCVGFIVLLVINSKATAVLKKHGVSVGLLGADPSDLE